MKDQRNQSARRKRLLRSLLRLAGLAALAAVVVFLAVRVVAALRSSGGGDASGSAGSQAVTSSGEPVDYEALTYTNGTATLRFLYEDGAWVWQDVPDFPLREEEIAAVAEAAGWEQPEAEWPVERTTFSMESARLAATRLIQRGVTARRRRNQNLRREHSVYGHHAHRRSGRRIHLL